MPATNVRRNDPCPCGSGKRYKECHGTAGLETPTPVLAAIGGAADLFQEALARYQRQEYVAAVAACQQVLAVAPDHAGAWHLAGSVDLQRGDLQASSLKIAKAIELDGAQAEFHRTLARVRLASGSFAEVTASARRRHCAGCNERRRMGCTWPRSRSDGSTSRSRRMGKSPSARALQPRSAFPDGRFSSPAAQLCCGSCLVPGGAGRRCKPPGLSNNLGLALQELGKAARPRRAIDARSSNNLAWSRPAPISVTCFPVSNV